MFIILSCRKYLAFILWLLSIVFYAITKVHSSFSLVENGDLLEDRRTAEPDLCDLLSTSFHHFLLPIGSLQFRLLLLIACAIFFINILKFFTAMRRNFCFCLQHRLHHWRHLIRISCRHRYSLCWHAGIHKIQYFLTKIVHSFINISCFLDCKFKHKFKVMMCGKE